jgi:hypothetical protein
MQAATATCKHVPRSQARTNLPDLPMTAQFRPISLTHQSTHRHTTVLRSSSPEPHWQRAVARLQGRGRRTRLVMLTTPCLVVPQKLAMAIAPRYAISGNAALDAVSGNAAVLTPPSWLLRHLW